MSLIFPAGLPTTSGLNFSEFFEDGDYSGNLNQLNLDRAALREALKKVKKSDNADYLSVVRACEEYIPGLFQLYFSTGKSSTKAPKPTWSQPLHQSFKGLNVKKIEGKGLLYEIGMVMLTFGLATAYLGEQNYSLSSSSDKWQPKRFVESLSIFNYLLSLSGIEPCAPDLDESTRNGLTALISGSIHLQILYRAMADPFKMSSGLLSRIAIFAFEKFLSAHTSFQASKGFTDNLQSWVASRQNHCIAFAQYHMALDKFAQSHTGFAIGLLQSARDSLRQKSKILAKGKTLESEDQTLLAAVDERLQQYRRDNELDCQPIPSLVEIQSGWPSGRAVVETTTMWAPPCSGSTSTPVATQNAYY